MCGILQVSHQLGRPLNRKFKSPRKIEFREQGWGLNIAPPPEPRPPRVRSQKLQQSCQLWLLLCIICPVPRPRNDAKSAQQLCSSDSISFTALFKRFIVWSVTHHEIGVSSSSHSACITVAGKGVSDQPCCMQNICRVLLIGTQA